MHQQTCTISNVCAKHFKILYKINVEFGSKSYMFQGEYKCKKNFLHLRYFLSFITVIECKYIQSKLNRCVKDAVSILFGKQHCKISLYKQINIVIRTSTDKMNTLI